MELIYPIYPGENLDAYIRTPMLNMSILQDEQVPRAHLILYKTAVKSSIFREILETAVTSGIVSHGLLRAVYN